MIRMKHCFLGAVCIVLLMIGKGYGAQLERVRAYMSPLISSAPMIIAYEEGFFKEQGIDLEFIKSKNTAEALLLLLQGSVDVIDGPLTAGIYNAVKEKQPVRIIAGTTQYVLGNNFAGIVIKKTPGLPQGKAGILKYLETRKIAMPIRGSMPNYFIETLFERQKISIEKINFSTISFPFIVEGLGAGTLDAGFLTEPFLSIARSKNIGFEFMPIADDFPDTQAAFVFYGVNLIEKKRDLGVRFLNAYLKGCQQYAQGKTPRNIDILRKNLALDDKLLEKMAWPVVVPEGILARKEIVRDFQAWLIRKNFLSAPIDIAGMFDTFFLNTARKE